MMAWESYKNVIKRHCASPAAAEKDLTYWRNDLFARTLIFLIPLCLIAALPGLYMCAVMGMYPLALANVSTVTTIVLVAFLPGIPIYLRKIIFITATYTFSWVLVYYLGFLGLYGNTLLFILSCCILFILIVPARYAYWSVAANALICAGFAWGIHSRVIGWGHTDPNALGIWISVSANLVFLSFLFALLIPHLFNGLQQTMANEQAVREQLKASQKEYSDLFSLNPLPMWVYAADTLRFLEVNEAAIIHYGFSREEFLAMGVRDIFADREPWLPGTEGAPETKNGALPEKAYTHLKKNGELVRVEISGTSIFYQGKKAVIHVVHDITESARYISTIEQQNNMLREIAWIQSHVVRAPLARMMGLIQVLQNEQVPRAQKDQLLSPLLTSAHELDELIRQVADKAHQVKARDPAGKAEATGRQERGGPRPQYQ